MTGSSFGGARGTSLPIFKGVPPGGVCTRRVLVLVTFLALFRIRACLAAID